MSYKDIYNSMKIVMKPITDLKAAEYNPRKITPGELKKLENDIIEFGFQKPVTVNVHKERKNIVVGGHQGLKILQKLGQTDVPCIEVNLPLVKEKQLNLKLNRNNGVWDFEIMKEHYTVEDLKASGFNDGELKSMMPTYDDLKVAEPVFPIVPRLSEKYSYVLIFADNEIDLAYLENFFKLQRQKSYKTSKVGLGRVVTFKSFMKIIKEWKK